MTFPFCTSLYLRILHILNTVYLTPLRFALLNFTSFHFTSLDSLMIFPQFQFALYITFVPTFQKLRRLEGRVPKAPASSWFERWMVLFTKEYIPICLFCFLLLIFPSWSNLLRQHGLCNIFYHLITAPMPPINISLIRNINSDN
jgi:hypothetical protein